jgi:hypothetical protein
MGGYAADIKLLLSHGYKLQFVNVIPAATYPGLSTVPVRMTYTLEKK